VESSKINRMNTLGDRFRFARKRANMTQARLGAFIGVSKSAISQIESNTTKQLSGKVLIGIELASGVSGRWISDKKGDCIIGQPMKAEDIAQIERIHSSLMRLPREYREKIEREIDFFASLPSQPE